jgi:tripartite-type tricarboxylate transporter receptor subunit TctC
MLSCLRYFLVAVLCGGFVTTSFADEYPSRPVRIIVPYPAGGPSDTATRTLAESLSRQFGQPVVVENRSGGGGLVGTEAGLRATPDGYTLVVGGMATLVLLPAVRPTLYDVQKDFVPLTQIWYAPQILAVRPTLGIKALPDLVAAAKADPGKLSFGSAGNGTVTHLAIMLFEQEAKLKVTHVPYRSTALWLNDAIGSQIDGGFGDLQTLTPHIQAGTIIPLAVSVPRRVRQLPNVPSFSELGLPGIHTENWFGLMALAQTPANVLTRLKSALEAAQVDPVYIASLAKLGGDAGQPGGEALKGLIAGDAVRFGPLIRQLSTQAK